MEQHGAGRQTTDDNIIGRMRIACRITKAKDTHSEYVIPLSFPLQEWLRENASMLCVHCLTCFHIVKRKVITCFLKVRHPRCVESKYNV